MSTDPGPEAVTQREIAETLRTFVRSNWRSMTLQINGIRVVVGKDGPPASTDPTAPTAVATIPGPVASATVPAPAPAPAPDAAIARAAPVAPRKADPPADTSGFVEVRSPAVGAFWEAPSPGSPPFVEVGQVVAADDQLAIVEVMKLMNPVVAPVAGEVAYVCAGNAELVEYDQVLFLLRPSHA